MASINPQDQEDRRLMSQLIKNSDDGVLVTLEQLAPSDRDQAGRPMVCVVDSRLVGSDEDRFTIAITVGGMREPGDSGPSRRILSSYQAKRDNLWDKVELLGGWDGGRYMALTLLVSAANFDASALASQLANLRSRFAPIQLVVIGAVSEGHLSDAATEQWLREQNIALAALGVAKPFRIEHRTKDGAPPNGSMGMAAFATSLGQVLRLASGGDGRAGQHLLVAQTDLAPVREPDAAVPFLSIVTRTHGKRFHTLTDVFCCLSAQECDDFEHIIVAHNLDTAAQAQLTALIEAQIPAYRARIRVVPVRGGNRTRPINAGFEAARGHYVSILDDDDIVFANWIEAFREQALRTPGRMLRAASVRQEYEEVTVNGLRASRAVSGMHDEYGRLYDHMQHLHGNVTPPVSVAFPRYVFSELHQKFDETLTTTEDWEYIVRCTSMVGAGSIEEITCIYRWWNKAYSSRTDHTQTEWDENYARIMERLCDHPYIFACDSIDKLRNRHKELNSHEKWAFHLKDENQQFREQLRGRDEEIGRLNDGLEDHGRTAKRLHGEVEHFRRDVEARDRDIEILHGITVDQNRELDQLRDRLAETQRVRTHIEEQLIFSTKPNKDGINNIKLSPLEILRGKSVKKRKKVRARTEFVLKSGLFDSAWYLTTYPDVARDNAGALEHFVMHGSRELRSPGPHFNARDYYLTNEDVRNSRMEPLFHYVLYGRAEGRNPTP